jgi:hypothetical protein
MSQKGWLGDKVCSALERWPVIDCIPALHRQKILYKGLRQHAIVSLHVQCVCALVCTGTKPPSCFAKGPESVVCVSMLMEGENVFAV